MTRRLEHVGSPVGCQVKVVRGGKLKARKGVNVPDVEIDCAALTAKAVLLSPRDMHTYCSSNAHNRHIRYQLISINLYICYYMFNVVFIYIYLSIYILLI